jgi:type IV secretion system protein VirB11
MSAAFDTGRSRRATALASALDPLAVLLSDPNVVEILRNADGVVWVDEMGVGLRRTETRMSHAQSDRMLRLIASEIGVQLASGRPSMSAKLPAPWGARLQGSIPPIVDAPTFALRKPPPVVFSLADYVRHQTQLRGLLRRELERTTNGDPAAKSEGRSE